MDNADGGLIAGIALTGGALYVFYSIYSSGDLLLNPQSIRAPRAFIALITRIGMLLGSPWGLWKTWISIWIWQN